MAPGYKRNGKPNIYERSIKNKQLGDETTKANLEFVNSNDFKRKFINITDNPAVNDSIYTNAKAAVIHRSASQKEDLIIISSESGRVLGKNVSCDHDLEVVPNESVINAVIENYGKTIGIHNHPHHGAPPSGSDFEAAQNRKYVFGIVACSDGTVYKYGVGDKRISAYLIDDTIEGFKKLRDEITGELVYNNENEAHLAALEVLRENYGIWYEKL